MEYRDREGKNGIWFICEDKFKTTDDSVWIKDRETTVWYPLEGIENIKAKIDPKNEYHQLSKNSIISAYKQFLKKQENPCECPPEFPQCICGKVQRLKILTRRPIRPADVEIETNPRARSAVLRAGEIL